MKKVIAANTKIAKITETKSVELAVTSSIGSVGMICRNILFSF
jgi:hypothetical protein